MKTFCFFVCLVVTLLEVNFVSATVVFRDGQTHNIDYQIGAEVEIDRNTPERYTTLNLVANGSITYDITGFCDSRINVIGGTARNVFVWGNCDCSMSAGYAAALVVADDGIITFTGGQTEQIIGYETGHMLVSGGHLGALRIQEGSHAIIEGFGFAVDGFPFEGELLSINKLGYSSDPIRRITGTLANGDTLNADFQIGNSAYIALNTVPEPTTAGLLISGLAVLLLRHHRRK